LSELTGAESGCITAGASAAITAGTAACVTGGDPDKLWKIPDLQGMKDEVIIPKYSRTSYDAAAKAVGVRMIEVEDIEGLKKAMGPRTAMILVLGGAQSRSGSLSTREISDLAKPLGIPILVDAAAEGLEVPNPHLLAGADLVAYSGGKKLRGPQCSGMLIGNKHLVSAARRNTGPHHGFGRGFKVGREEIMGLMAAVEMWFKRDFEAEARIQGSMVENMKKKLSPIEGLTLTGTSSSLRVQWDLATVPLTGYDVEQLLWDNTPRIAVSLSGSYLPFPPNRNPNFGINISQLEPGEETIIAERVYEIFSKPQSILTPTPSPAAANISGVWDLEIDFGASKVKQTLNFEQKGNELMGAHLGDIGSRELEGTLNGSSIHMRSSYTLEGVRINYTFTGTASADIMSGDVSLSEYGKAKWSAKRRVFRMS
jgi:D-glucosaminate-6-phosphate ammonia-lyase